jgi:hypothetical protein
MVLDTMEVQNNTVFVNTLDELEVFIEFYNPEQPTFANIVEETQKLLDGGLIDPLSALYRIWVDTELKSEDEVLEMYDKLQGDIKDIVDAETNAIEGQSDSTNDELNNEEDEEDVE